MVVLGRPKKIRCYLKLDRSIISSVLLVSKANDVLGTYKKTSDFLDTNSGIFPLRFELRRK